MYIETTQFKTTATTSYDKYDSHSSIPKNEWDAIYQYLKGAIVALKNIIPAAIEGDCYRLNGQQLLDCKYDKLDNHDNNLDNMLQLDHDTCDMDLSMDFSRYVNLEIVDTEYSKPMEIIQNPKDKDTCFAVDGVLQVCTSYRPHLYEMMVHSSSKYLNEEVKRVLFLGSGNSMLLHETLKHHDNARCCVVVI